MNRYQLQQSTQQQGWWVLTDKENGIVCRFREHEFNETQQMTFLEDVEQPDATAIARLMSEMGDWLALHHYNVAMPPVTFCIQQTDDARLSIWSAANILASVLSSTTNVLPTNSLTPCIKHRNICTSGQGKEA